MSTVTARRARRIVRRARLAEARQPLEWRLATLEQRARRTQERSADYQRSPAAARTLAVVERQLAGAVQRADYTPERRGLIAGNLRLDGATLLVGNLRLDGAPLGAGNLRVDGDALVSGDLRIGPHNVGLAAVGQPDAAYPASAREALKAGAAGLERNNRGNESGDQLLEVVRPPEVVDELLGDRERCAEPRVVDGQGTAVAQRHVGQMDLHKNSPSLDGSGDLSVGDGPVGEVPPSFPTGATSLNVLSAEARAAVASAPHPLNETEDGRPLNVLIPATDFEEFGPTSPTVIRPQEAPKVRWWKRRPHSGRGSAVLLCSTRTGGLVSLALPDVSAAAASADPDPGAGPSVSRLHRGVYLLRGARVDVDAT